jgi:hypothetical protein
LVWVGVASVQSSIGAPSMRSSIGGMSETNNGNRIGRAVLHDARDLRDEILVAASAPQQVESHLHPGADAAAGDDAASSVVSGSARMKPCRSEADIT